MRPVLHRLHEVEEEYDSDCSWNSTDSFAHHLLNSCMGGNLYSYYKCKEISHVPSRFCSGVGSFVRVDPAFSNLDTIRSEKRSRRREDEGK